MEANVNPGDVHERLQQVRNALLTLHKTLVESERETYEKTFGKIPSSNHFLKLLTNDPWFAWMHPLSLLIVAMDEALDEKEPLTTTNVESLIKQGKTMLIASENGEGFPRHYYEALQRDPDVVLAHADASKMLNGKKYSA